MRTPVVNYRQRHKAACRSQPVVFPPSPVFSMFLS